MVKDLDKNLIKNLTKAIKELTVLLKKTDLSNNVIPNLNLNEKSDRKRVNIDHPNALKSPMVGTVYLSPEPGSRNFIKQGQVVKKGDTLLIIEAMKTFNPIKAQKSGKILKILVNDAEPIEYGQPLLVLK